MARIAVPAAVVCLALAAPIAVHAAVGPEDILGVMKEELDRSMSNLADASDASMYFLQYSVTELHDFDLGAMNGGLDSPQQSSRRYLDVDIRVGSMELDNTHEIRGGSWRDNYAPARTVEFPLEADGDAIKAALWNETEYQYQKAQERLTKVETNRQVLVEEEDLSNDFSPTEPQEYVETVRKSQIDREHWAGILSRVGDYLASHDFVKTSSASLSLQDKLTFMVNSEGSSTTGSASASRAWLTTGWT